MAIVFVLSLLIYETQKYSNFSNYRQIRLIPSWYDMWSVKIKLENNCEIKKCLLRLNLVIMT